MAEQTFRSPGFFEREIDLSQRESEIVGVPAGVAGTAEMGPAFVPVTVGSFADFERKFGSLDPKMFGPYAVREFFKHKTALTYVRVLGAGANETTTDIANTVQGGIVKAAGFKILGSVPAAEGKDKRFNGSVQFIVARHYVSGNNGTTPSSVTGYPIFRHNDSFSVSRDEGGAARMIRGMLFTTTGSRFQIITMNSASWVPGVTAASNDTASPDADGRFKLVLSSAAGASFKTTDGYAGIRVYTASLNPSRDDYISKILNTDPERFGAEQHLLYAHFPVDPEIAKVSTTAYGSGNTTALSSLTIKGPSVALVSGSDNTSLKSGVSSLKFLNGYGRFDTRYRSPRTTAFISQPYGTKEHDLFHFECISDGAVANEKFKVSISNVRKSSDPTNPYGTFTVEVRSFDDTDTNLQVLESYPQCTLNPSDDDYIAKKIGDYKAYYNFDAESEDERKVLVSGKYANMSSRIRVQMSVGVENRDVPTDAIPFGFRGFPSLKTSDTLTDRTTSALRNRAVGKVGNNTSRRLTMTTGVTGSGIGSTGGLISQLSGSIMPPVPFTFKVTRGKTETSPAFAGDPGDLERVDSRYYWGAKFTRVPRSSSLPDSVLNPNAGSEINDLFRNYSKLLAIEKLDNVVTGTGADEFNNNKFTMARIALSNKVQNNSSGNPDLSVTANSHLTGTAKEHILEAAYIRNGVPAMGTYTVNDGQVVKRLTFASLAALTSSVYFNRFSNYTKFTNFFYGGFDGVNILDQDMARMNDKASSSDTGGLATGATLDIGLSGDNSFGSGKTNNTVASYRTAARVLTDPMVSRINILVIPGIRDSAVTDFIQDRLSGYGKGFYVMDLPAYDADQNRLFDGSNSLPSVSKTSEALDGRALDSNFSAAYFPDVTIADPINNRPVDVPSSVAVLGALAYNDSVAYPWFAPAGFNRAALDFVSNVRVRLNAGDRDDLYDARINPIATFPGAGYVIFGQKTLQMSKSALDRVNVRRMLLEVKRQVVDVANKIVFEANTPSTRARFVSQVTPLLATIQSQQGIDQFKVIMDSSNNTNEDVENNVLNGRVVVVPTRAVEFISMDFIITHSGVSFE